MNKLKYFLKVLIFFCASHSNAQSWIRVNQLGYLPYDVKVAVLISKDKEIDFETFSLHDALTGKISYRSIEVPGNIKRFEAWAGFEKSFRLNFSGFSIPGSYYISVKIKGKEIRSPIFKIGNDVYDGTADFLLNYMRQQRCGFNPLLLDSCHTAGCFVVYGKEKNIDSIYLPIWGGWHDASDYLQYSTTSANAIFQMLMAYEKNPNSFSDKYDAAGLPTPNGIPDILDEAKWGLDWLCRMNPSPDIMFNQIADDRDHRYMRLPNQDTITYGYKAVSFQPSAISNYSENKLIADSLKLIAVANKSRPVYLVTGEPQGLGKYKNKTRGVSSTAGKFSSAFAVGARLLKKFYPSFADSLQAKAVDAYKFAQTKLGNCQTAPNRAPYYYEEDNFYDDLELAAIELYKNSYQLSAISHQSSENKKNDTLTADSFKLKAIKWGLSERGSKWMGADTARHYQYYPFVNVGHAEFFNSIHDSSREDFVNFYKTDLKKLYERGKNNPFMMGVPFVWCSNNYVAAALTELDFFLADSTKNFKSGEGAWFHRINKDIYSDYLHKNKDTLFVPDYVRFTCDMIEMRAALRDWLFGCNPWGTSMIYGLPRKGVSPHDPHSAFTHIGHYDIDGGLVDGPIYGSIFKQLIGLKLYHLDTFADFQSPLVVYHDDYGDYSTNEPTMDGTASLTYYLSSLEKRCNLDKTTTEKSFSKAQKDKFDVVTRFDTSEKLIYLVFTGHEFADGGKVILKTLRQQNIKASFFFTGDFVRNYPRLVKKLYKEGHFIGPHSDKHLLYCDWTKRDSTLITKDSFAVDLWRNQHILDSLGVNVIKNRVFMPPYEWYNQDISNWSNLLGMHTINFTNGTSSNADYTTPDEKNYKSSTTILKSIDDYEKKNTLNGFILLSHIGTDPKRKDKFYRYLNDLIKKLKGEGYGFAWF